MNFLEYRSCIIQDGAYAKSTKVCCWHCTEPFEGVPATVPIRYVKNQQTWEVVGVFCSWPCAKTWQMTRPAYNSRFNECGCWRWPGRSLGTPDEAFIRRRTHGS